MQQRYQSNQPPLALHRKGYCPACHESWVFILKNIHWGWDAACAQAAVSYAVVRNECKTGGWAWPMRKTPELLIEAPSISRVFPHGYNFRCLAEHAPDGRSLS